MSKLLVNRNEISFLEENLNQKIQKDFDLDTIAWNSNPDNYRLAAEQINVLLDSILTEHGISNSQIDAKISHIFLRDFFYYQDENKKVRQKSLDRLYFYLFSKSRKDFLSNEKVDFSNKKQIFVTIGRSTPIGYVSLLSKKTGFVGQRIIQMTEIPSLMNNIYSRDVDVCIYVNEKFLKDERGIKILVELFSRRFISTVLNSSLTFEFSEELRTWGNSRNILDASGRLGYIRYWMNLKKDYLGALAQNDPMRKLFNHLSSDTLSFMLRSLENAAITGNLGFNYSIDAFLPVLLRLCDDCKAEPLSNIYFDREDPAFSNYGKDFTYFCTIGSDKYLIKKEKSEMFSYFKQFATNLRNANLVRVFNVPAKRVKNKGWSSNLDIATNELLYQYVQLNVVSGVKTAIFFYDDSKNLNDLEILLNQDYIFRFKQPEVRGNSIGSLAKLAYENRKEIVRQYIPSLSNRDLHSEIYLPYPETFNGENQIMRIKTGKYLEQLLGDFLKRVYKPEFSKHQAELSTFDNNASDIKKLKMSLNISSLDYQSIEKLDKEVMDFLDIKNNKVSA